MPMDDEARHELAKKLDEDLDKFIEEKLSKPRPKVPEDNRSMDEIIEELKQHPAFMTEFDPTKPMSPAMEGLQQLKYMSDDAEHNADSFKDDGNVNFRRKNYRWAIDNYTQGIRELCKDKELNAMLYCNRAACHFHLQNYRSSLRDAVVSLKFKATHMKAIVRACMCCIEIKKYKEGIKWCEEGLSVDPEHAKLLEMRPKLEKLLKEHEKEKRKEMLKERKSEATENELIKMIESRGVKLAGSKNSTLKNIQSDNPTGAKVHFDDNGVLHWPVLFLYPEFGESDFIEVFNENTTLEDHIYTMFGDTAMRPPWDKEVKYNPENIEVYFEDKADEKLIKLKKSVSLKDILKHDKYLVYGGMPGFILLVKNSDFANNFLSQYGSSE